MDRVGGLSKCDVQTGWVEHTTDSVSSCYHFSGIVLAPWLEAQENCQKRGGDLVVISSDDENDIVYGMAGGEAFKVCRYLKKMNTYLLYQINGIIFIFLDLDWPFEL